ncbi:transcriptional regulator family: Fungal Specific TF [Paecilomyces variotii]|nr:transcriptional regulator family: Fungal Specific TF [Paecilomyces variotii]
MMDVTLQDGLYLDGSMPPKCGIQVKRTMRPRTSCNQCRFRKIKCDRIKPCSACCSRGKPTDCCFPVDANNRAIDQARQLRLLRKENAELRELLEKKSPRDTHLQLIESAKNVKRLHASIWRQLKAEEPSHTLVYGSPSGSEIGEKLPSLQNQPSDCRPTSLAHPRLKNVNILSYQDAPADPFPCLWEPSSGTKPLLQILPSREQILKLLTIFDSQARCFQYLPNKLATPEINAFLENLHDCAERNPQMLALILAAMAHALQFKAFRKNMPQSAVEETEKELVQANIYVAASMHALRLSSFMNRPTLLAVHTLLLIGAYLVNGGKFLDAYTLYGQTIRVAQGMGLHQDPQYLDSCADEGECNLRRNTWWLMLFVDQYYSSTLGRPLGVSGTGDCLPASHLTFSELADSQKAGRLETYINQYTVLSRQILSCDNLTNGRIDAFSDRLLQLLDTLPSLVRFNSSWLKEGCDNVPEWPLNFHAAMFHSNTHNYLILLNRQRQIGTVEKKQKKTDVYRPEPGYATVVSSCHEVLQAFFYLHKYLPDKLAHWPICQHAFNAAMLLGFNVLEHGCHAGSGDHKTVASTYSIFHELHETGVSRPAKLATLRLRELLDRITHKEPILDQRLMGSHGMLLVEDPEIRGMVGNAYAPFAWSEASIQSNAEEPVYQKRQPEHTSHIGAMEHARMFNSPAPSEHSSPGNSTPVAHSPDLNSENASSTNSPNCALTPETPTYWGPEDRWTATHAAPMQAHLTCPPFPTQLLNQQLFVSSAPVQEQQHHFYASPSVYHQGYTDWGLAYPGMSTDMSSYYAYVSIS